MIMEIAVSSQEYGSTILAIVDSPALNFSAVS